MPIKASEVKAGDRVVCDSEGMEYFGYSPGKVYRISRVDPEIGVVIVSDKPKYKNNWQGRGLIFFSKVEEIPYNNYTE